MRSLRPTAKTSRWLSLAVFLGALTTACGSGPSAAQPGRLAYSVNVVTGSQSVGIQLVDDQGGNRAALTKHPLSIGQGIADGLGPEPRWSPVGQKILFETDPEPGVWSVNADGSGLRSFGSGFNAAWSHDGRRVALFDDAGDIPVYAASGRRIETLSSNVNNRDSDLSDSVPQWSPDGREIAYDVYTEGGEPYCDCTRIYVIRTDGRGGPRLLSRGKQPDDSSPAWSPQGDRIAFLAARSENSGTEDLWMMRSDGTSRAPVARGVSAFAWSPDGRFLAYAEDRRSNAPGGIYLVRPSGGGASRIGTATSAYELLWSAAANAIAVEDSRGTTIVDPEGRLLARLPHVGSFSWAPDGKAFVHADRVTLDVARMDGKEARTVLNLQAPVLESVLSWSPNGSRIAFQSDDGGVHVMTGNGIGHRLLARAWLRADGGSPQWSPDGRSLVFATADAGSPEGRQIFLLRTNGGGRVIASGSRRNPVRDPVWSPDGAMIAFVREKLEATDGQLEVTASMLQAIRPDGSGLRTIAQGHSFGAPAWTEGKGILISDDDGSLRQVAADGGSVTVIARSDLSEFDHLGLSPDGERAAFARIGKGVEVVDLDSGKVHELIRDSGVYGTKVAWSPDGNKLAYVSSAYVEEIEHIRLYVVEADGSNRRRISRPGESVIDFSWRPATEIAR